MLSEGNTRSAEPHPKVWLNHSLELLPVAATLAFEANLEANAPPPSASLLAPIPLNPGCWAVEEAEFLQTQQKKIFFVFFLEWGRESTIGGAPESLLTRFRGL